ncbi:MAG: hypothetical protein FWD58_03985 [Firmicutes bacterium]|nr:hypothetical protein [Bacillota bacterium]
MKKGMKKYYTSGASRTVVIVITVFLTIAILILATLQFALEEDASLFAVLFSLAFPIIVIIALSIDRVYASDTKIIFASFRKRIYNRADLKEIFIQRMRRVTVVSAIGERSLQIVLCFYGFSGVLTAIPLGDYFDICKKNPKIKIQGIANNIKLLNELRKDPKIRIIYDKVAEGPIDTWR